MNSPAKQEPEILLRQMRENLPLLIEYACLQAKLHRAKFVALLEQGFTEAQALELAKHIP